MELSNKNNSAEGLVKTYTEAVLTPCLDSTVEEVHCMLEKAPRRNGQLFKSSKINMDISKQQGVTVKETCRTW